LFFKHGAELARKFHHEISGLPEFHSV